MKLLIFFLSMTLIACEADGPDPVAEANTDNWWEVEGDNPASASNSIPSPAEDDKGKDESDKGDGAPDVGKSWTCQIDTDSAEGTCTYLVNTPDTGEQCQLYIAVTELDTAEDCTSCSFAWNIILGEATIIAEEAEGCAEFAALEGSTLRFGQGNETVGSFGGVNYYTLLQQSEDTWTLLSNGYSNVKNETLWIFGAK